MKSILKQIYQNSRFNNSEIIKLIVDSFSENINVRIGVADNPSTPVYILGFLSKDKDYYVRERVAYNPNIPSFTLEFLSKDEYDSVRYYVARNPNTPSSTLEFLSKDKNKTVRIEIAWNPTYIKYKEENGL